MQTGQSEPEPAARRGLIARLAKSRAVQVAAGGFSALALVIGFTNDVFGLLGDSPPPPPPATTAIDTERASLLLAHEWFYQTPIRKHFRAGARTTTQLRWRAVMSVANTSASPIVVRDIETLFPKDDTGGVELRRTAKADTITVFSGRADWLAVNRLDDAGQATARFERSLPMPLILQSGQRLIVEYEQAFELVRGGQAQSFTAGDELPRALEPLIPMRPAGDGLRCPFGLELTTIVRTANGEITKDVAYVLLITGCQVVMPSKEEVERLRESGDDPLGDG